MMMRMAIEAIGSIESPLSTMTFQDEPRGSVSSKELPIFDITAAEVQQLLADSSGHGLSNYLLQNAESAIKNGSTLKTPFRVLWYAENLGLTREVFAANRKDSVAVSIDSILAQLNQSNQMNGKAPVGRSTIINALSPLANALLKAFRVKLLIDRRGESIKLLSEAWAAEFVGNMRQDYERQLRRMNDVMEQAQRIGVNTDNLIAGTEIDRTRRILIGANN